MGNAFSTEKTLVNILNKFDMSSYYSLSRVIKHIENISNKKDVKMVCSKNHQTALMYLLDNIYCINIDYQKELFGKVLRDIKIISECDINGRNVLFYIMNKKITNELTYKIISTTLEKLIMTGIDINKKDIHGRNVLFYFLDQPHCYSKYSDILDLLLERDIQLNERDSEGESVMSRIIFKNYDHVFVTLKKLISYGYDFNSCNVKNETLLIKIFSGPISPKVLDIFNYIINLGCHTNTRTILGNTAIMTMLKNIRYGCTSDLNIFKTLVKYSDVNTINLKGETPLILAAKLTHYGDYKLFISALLNAGADINTRDIYGNSYIDYIKKDQVKSSGKIFIQFNDEESSFNTLKYKNTKYLECNICFERIDTTHSIIPCGHSNICEECFPKFKICPYCKQNIISSSLINIIYN